MNLRREQFSKAATRRTAGARSLLGAQGGDPQLACYLLHVALECALKLLLLYQQKATHMEELRRVMPPDDFERLFQTSRGHDLRLLADHASLKRFLTAREKAEFLSMSAWKRITHGDRPYSLRYGTESVSREEASDELTLGEPLILFLVEKCS